MSPIAELSAFLDLALPLLRDEWGTDHDDAFDAMMAWQRILAEGNWVAPAWPVEHGGRGVTPAERIACEEELWRRRAPMIAGTLGLKNVGPTIAHWGTPHQKAPSRGSSTGPRSGARGSVNPTMAGRPAHVRRDRRRRLRRHPRRSGPRPVSVRRTARSASARIAMYRSMRASRTRPRLRRYRLQALHRTPARSSPLRRQRRRRCGLRIRLDTRRANEPAPIERHEPQRGEY